MTRLLPAASPALSSANCCCIQGALLSASQCLYRLPQSCWKGRWPQQPAGAGARSPLSSGIGCTPYEAVASSATAAPKRSPKRLWKPPSSPKKSCQNTQRNSKQIPETAAVPQMYVSSNSNLPPVVKCPLRTIHLAVPIFKKNFNKSDYANLLLQLFRCKLHHSALRF